MNRIAFTGGLLALALSGVRTQVTVADETDKPSITAPNGLSNSAVETSRGLAEVTASQANSKATVRLGIDHAIGYSADTALLHPISWNGSVTGSAPLGTGSDPTQLATLDNLADAAQVQLKSQWVFSNYLYPTDENSAKYRQDISKAVAETNAQLSAITNKDQLAAKIDALKKAGCKIDSNRIVQKFDTGTAYCALPVTEANDYDRLYFPHPQLLIIPGFGSAIGQKSYKYLNATSDSNIAANRTPWSAQAYVGIHVAYTLTTIGYRFDRSFKDASQASLCPIPKSALTTCKTGPLGIPTETEQSVPYLEYRQRIGMGFAIAPIVNYDLRKSVLGISVPVYFISDSMGNLTGGLALGWRSDKSGLQLSVVVNTAFSAYTIK
jgi:hypothetical protein